MNLQYSQVIKHLIYDFKSERELIDSISLVSKAFTSDRENIGDYLEDAKLISAYTAFYFTTNYPKLGEIVNKINFLENIINNCEVIEVGAGPGSFSFPLAAITDKKVYGVESSQLMREQANNLNQHLFKYSNISFCEKSSDIPKSNEKRILFFTNSFNEMGELKALEYIRELDPDYVFFIEPGTKDVFTNILSVRDKLIKRKFNVVYPCSANTACPIENKDDWCHQYLKLDLDLDVKRVAQLVRINRKWQSACLFFFSKAKLTREDEGIILRSYPPTKFSIDWDLCKDNEIKRYVNKKRDFSKSDYKHLKNYLAGDVIP